MITRTLIIQNPEGLHARPASLFVEMCSRFKSKIVLRKGKTLASATSVLQLMLLGAGYQSEVELIVDGEDEDRAVAELSSLVTDDAA